MKRLVHLTAVLMVALVALPLSWPELALAHERRTVGKYQLVVGWAAEPATAGQLNGVDLRITDADTKEPVDGAEKTLRVSIAFGGNPPKEFPLRARSGQKGAYTADVIPTRAGSYLFSFTGAIKDQQVSETFESGPGRFNDVTAASELQVPEVAQSTSEVSRQAVEARARAEAAEGAAAQARMVGVGGLVAGLLGVATASAALLAGRRRAAALKLEAERAR